MGLYHNIVHPRFWIPITPYLKQTNSVTIESDTIEGVNRLIGLDPYDPVFIDRDTTHKITFKFLDN